MENKQQLEKAIFLIKSGDIKSGGEALSNILKGNPQNELAWLWMAKIVNKEEQREHCLKQVLRINPNNKNAKQGMAILNKLQKEQFLADELQPVAKSLQEPSELKQQILSNDTSPTPSAVIPKPKNPTPKRLKQPSSITRLESPPASSKGSKKIPDVEYWISPERKLSHITILTKRELIFGTLTPDVALQVEESLRKGTPPTNLLATKTGVSLSKITKVWQTMSSVRVNYTDNGTEVSTRLECTDTEMANAIINSLHRRLGTKFELTSKPLGIMVILMVALIFLVPIALVSVFFYQGALEVAAGNVNATGSARSRGLISLFSLILGVIGPSGVICIGGSLFLLALGITIYLLIKPPLKTELIPKNQASPKTDNSN